MMKSLEFEQLTLGAILRDNSVLNRVPELTADHFFLPDNRAIFGAICRLVSKGESADVATVARELPEIDFAYLAELEVNVPSIASARTYAARVIDDAMRRKLKDVTSELAEEVSHDVTSSAVELLEKVQSRVMGIGTRNAGGPVRASTAMLKHVAEMEDRTEGRIKTIGTGFSNIDSLLNGGFIRTNLVIIGARPSMGKTALALNIAASIAKTKKVLFLSQEMSTGELMDRLCASLGRVDLSAILRGSLTQEQWQNFTQAVAQIEAMNMFIDDQGGLSIADVRAKARGIKRQYGLDVLFVDYLQLMNGQGANRNAEIEEISRGLKNLAKELDIVVVCLSQLNREVDKRTNRRPVMSDLRDSGSIEQDANIIMFLHRDEVYNPDSSERGFADLSIQKNRQGRTGNLVFRYVGEQTLFVETSESKPRQKRDLDI